MTVPWGVLASQSDEDALRGNITAAADQFHADVASRGFIGRTLPAVPGSLEAATTTGWGGILAVGMHRSRAANGLHGHLFLINPQHPTTAGSQVVKPMLASIL